MTNGPKTYNLPWGKDERIGVALPPRWRVIVEHHCRPPAPIADFPAAVDRALAAPTAGPPLAELAANARRVAVVIDDVGRPTPAHLMAPAVIDALVAAGVAPERIAIVFAMGTHRPMTQQEMQRKAGTAAGRVACANHDCRDSAALVRLGVTSFSTPVLINRAVASADLRVLIGTIEPHPQAGFGGGLKLILPGVAGAASIGHNHLILPSPERYNMIGTLPEHNPMRQDIEAAAAMLAGQTFILNTVLGPTLDPVALVSGDAIAAHRAGVAVARELFGVPLPRRLDAAIVSAYPMDVDLRQGVKGVANFPGAVRPGGAILCFLRCERGMEDVRLPGFTPPIGLLRGFVKLLGARGIYALSRRLPARVPVEARFIINFGLQVLKDYHVMIFSPRLAQDTGGRLSDLIFSDQAPMFARAERLLGQADPEACLVAEGGVSFPVVES
jgi:lactate racemase